MTNPTQVRKLSDKALMEEIRRLRNYESSFDDSQVSEKLNLIREYAYRTGKYGSAFSLVKKCLFLEDQRAMLVYNPRLTLRLANFAREAGQPEYCHTLVKMICSELEHETMERESREEGDRDGRVLEL